MILKSAADATDLETGVVGNEKSNMSTTLDKFRIRLIRMQLDALGDG